MEARTILIVDDESPVVELSAEALEAAGYRTVTAVSGLQALDRIQDGGVDLLLTDAVMPGMPGLELARRAREMVSSLPVLVMSGHRSVIESEAWQLSGVSGYLNKPFTPAELRAVVENALATRT